MSLFGGFWTLLSSISWRSISPIVELSDVRLGHLPTPDAQLLLMNNHNSGKSSNNNKNKNSSSGLKNIGIVT